MTSKNSFWANSLENQKRRIWVWIVAFLMWLLNYVGVLTVYLSRIKYWYGEGAYRNLEEFQKAFVQAAQDALGFQESLFITVAISAVIIGHQGFAYLNDRRKVDMYHSVPVSKKRRFFVIYVNGIIIYLTAALFSLVIGTVVAAKQGAVTGSVLAVIGIAFVWNLIWFLVIYHTMILAVMLTGNNFVALCAFAVLSVYEYVLYSCIRTFKYNFFERVNDYYVPFGTKLSVLDDYTSHTYELKSMSKPQEMAQAALPYLGKWVILALVLFIAAYVCYNKRMSEAAGKAIAFRKIKPVIKILVVVEVSMIVGGIVRDAAYENDMLMLTGMIVGAVICCAVMEVIYEFDLKCILHHWISSCAAVLCVLAVFCIFKFDLLGYDSYVPDADQVESVLFEPNADYGNYWNEELEYVSRNSYLMEHMHITAVEDVLTLARKDQQESYESMNDPRRVEVVYHLKSGRDVERAFWVDFDNPANEELLNHIIGSKEYREGMYQIVQDDAFCDKVKTITYSNGCVSNALPLEDAETLREAYLKDLEQMDFSLLRKNFACGTITFGTPNYMSIEYPVYDTYSNVISYLKERGVYYPVWLDAENIASIRVTNYHNEMYANEEGEFADPASYNLYSGTMATAVDVYGAYEDLTVQETFYEKEQIEEIIKHIYPCYLPSNWNDVQAFDSNYIVNVEFKKDSDYPYDRTQYYFNYSIFAGQVPEFVAEATALE